MVREVNGEGGPRWTEGGGCAFILFLYILRPLCDEGAMKEKQTKPVFSLIAFLG